jgi:hypothetical protein
MVICDTVERYRVIGSRIRGCNQGTAYLHSSSADVRAELISRELPLEIRVDQILLSVFDPTQGG